MSNDKGVIIAKRSVSLTKSYPIIGVFLSIFGLVFSSLSGLVNTIPASNTTSGVDVRVGVPYLGVPMQSLAALIFATSVLLLFVYDKNNGVLEYLLSLGMTERDIYRQYLKAALYLALGVTAFNVAIDLVAGVVEGTIVEMAGLSFLVLALGVSAVAFGTMLMMSFSSLQKQRVGSNQPLGLAIGAFLVMPSYVVPLVLPSAAFKADLILAGAVMVMALVTYLAAGRLISREKLLP